MPWGPGFLPVKQPCQPDRTIGVPAGEGDTLIGLFPSSARLGLTGMGTRAGVSLGSGLPTRGYAKRRIARGLREGDHFRGEPTGVRKMGVKVATVTLALSLPVFLWPPKPARAATADFAPAMVEPALVAPALAYR